MNKTRFKITIEYVGTNFYGWQIQDNVPSVQEYIESAIYKCTKEKVQIQVAGRTDKGVHATGQVAHFDLESYEKDSYILMLSINYFLRPHKIAIIDCECVDNNFHARFSAKKRHYIYKILFGKAANVIYQDLKYLIYRKLDVALMREGADFFVGTHDFTSFRATQCQAASPIKTIDQIRIDHIKNEIGDELHIFISASSFLHHMVRNMVGALVDVGLYKIKPSDIKSMIDAKDRKKASYMAPAHGLYLDKIEY